MKEYPEIMTVKQLQEYLQLSKNRVYDLLLSGKIPACKIDKLWRIKKEDIDKFIEDQKRKGDNR